MKTLEQIKNDYAVSKGYDNFCDILYNEIDIEEISEHIDNVMILTQKECLKLASENAYCETGNNQFGYFSKVAKESITNENNIIK